MQKEDEFEFVILRHGYSLGNILLTLSGQSNVPLLEKGRLQLLKLKEEYYYPVCDRNYSSDLDRCVDTFNTIYEGRAQLDGISKEIREIWFGDLENTPQKNKEHLLRFFVPWLEGKNVANEESFEAIAARTKGFLIEKLRELQKDGLHSLLFATHSVSARVLLISLGAFQKEEFAHIEIGNGKGYVLKLSFDGKEVKVLHLRPLPLPKSEEVLRKQDA